MKTIALSAITVRPGRQRKIFDPGKLNAFTDRLKTEGLFHPIVLRVEGDQYTLVAGERRLRAVTDLAGLGEQIRHDGDLVPLGFIPYTLFEDLDPLAAREAEFSENYNREDLTWQEEAAAVKELYELRTAQAVARGLAPPSVTDVAVERLGADSPAAINGSPREAVRRQLLVANHLDDPEVRGAKTTDEALSILKRKEAVEKNRVLGEAIGRSFTADVHRVLNEDSLAWMRECPADQFDVILTDPPYGMGADEFGDSGGRAAGAHGYEDSEENALQCYSVLAREGWRVAKAQAHLYAFCDIDLFPRLKELFAAAGWQVFRTPLIWYKKAAMRAPWPQHGPQRKYETILYAVKGKRLALKVTGDVLEFAADANLGHAAQKSVALYEELLRRSAQPGDAVLDAFCGSGPIFPAAHAVKCRATGIERDAGAYALSVQRVEGLKTQGELVL